MVRRGSKPVGRRLGIRSCPSSLQLPFSAAT